ncbi:GNAT family N-acetyltransferase [Aquimarina longa]|uniref:GNAT family N-acetyltransferase n=1 Tax=Aquimarina longa TaxID=1080221 RepID=UPI0007851323|nr:GNAT family N-acetyltransferase [Aquimarina longa]
MIKITKYSELDSNTKTILKNYIDTEFGHIPIVNKTKWASPDYTLIFYHNNKIATFYNIVQRAITINDETYKVAGINNVITPKEYRGKGYASKLLKETETYIFNDLKCDYGVLLCADTLIPFYKKLGWYAIDCPVYFKQPNGKQLWKANTMLLANKNKVKPKLIDLKGLPW